MVFTNGQQLLIGRNIDDIGNCTWVGMKKRKKTKKKEKKKRETKEKGKRKKKNIWLG